MSNGTIPGRSRTLRSFYDLLNNDLEEGEQTALAKAHAKNVTPLVRRLTASIAACGEWVGEGIDEPFHDSGRADVRAPDRARSADEIADTIDFAAHICDRPVCTVSNAETLSFRYVDREISPLRTRARDKGDRPPTRSLDLLLRNAADGRPILAELKIAKDRLPYFALVQLLSLAADLLPPPQRERLSKHYPALEMPADSLGPFLDLYLITLRPARGRYRAEALTATEQISEKLMTHRTVGNLVRRIAYIEATPTPTGLEFEQEFAFGAGH